MVLSPCLQQIVLQCVTEECTKTFNSLRMDNWKVAAGAADKVPPGYARSLFIPCFLYLSHSNSSLFILSTYQLVNFYEGALYNVLVKNCR